MTDNDSTKKKGPPAPGSSRRDFLRGSGLAAATAVLENPPLVAMKNFAWETIAKAILAAALPSPRK